MNQIAQLREILAEEQARLDVEEEWDISIRWAKKSDLAPFPQSDPKLYNGWVLWSKSHPLNEAEIVIVKRPDANYRPVIIHELLHILLNRSGPGSERVIEVLTDAIVKG